MTDNINPLEYHYKTSIKLDYFILSADIALLGWTIVNTDWLPNGEVFVWLIGAFWIFIILSIICGITRQLHNGIMFGLNSQYLQAGELANTIERSSLQGGSFLNQQTNEVISSEEFGKFASPHRDKEKEGKELYEKFGNSSALFANFARYFLIIALCLLAGIKIYILIN